MSEITLSERIERSIFVLENIGEASYTDLHPSPEKYSVAEKAKIIHDYVMSVARLQMWLDVINDVAPENRTDRMNVLDALLNRRLLEAATIIMSLSLVN